MFLKKLKKQTKKLKKRKKNNFRYFISIFIISAVIATGFFVYAQTINKNPQILPIIEKPPLNNVQSHQQTLDGGLFSATFTDGFSSQAWLDVGQTDLYFDWTGTNLLFPLSITTKEITTQDPLISEELVQISTDKSQEDSILSLPEITELVIKKNPKQVVITSINGSNSYMIGLTQEKAFEIWEYKTTEKNLKLLLGKTTEYAGHLALLSRHDNVFVLWASYFTLAYRIDDNNVVKDLSDSFGWRISSNNLVKLYEIDGFVYIVNEGGSIIRYNDEINVSIDQEFWFTYQPESLEIIDNYLIAKVPKGGTKIYQFEDRGFNLQGTRQVVSKKVNFSVKNIGAAQISNIDAGVENSDTKYFLSNDGGLNWQETTPGQIVIFSNQDDANDLRWKIVITPDNGIAHETPYLSSIHFKYWHRR